MSEDTENKPVLLEQVRKKKLADEAEGEQDARTAKIEESYQQNQERLRKERAKHNASLISNMQLRKPNKSS